MIFQLYCRTNEGKCHSLQKAIVMHTTTNSKLQGNLNVDVTVLSPPTSKYQLLRFQNLLLGNGLFQILFSFPFSWIKYFLDVSTHLEVPPNLNFSTEFVWQKLLFFNFLVLDVEHFDGGLTITDGGHTTSIKSQTFDHRSHFTSQLSSESQQSNLNERKNVLKYFSYSHDLRSDW